MKINYIQGCHNGRWTNEYDRKDSSEEYLNHMKEIADNYNIDYSDMINIKNDKKVDEYCINDVLGYDIKRAVEKHLMELLNV